MHGRREVAAIVVEGEAVNANERQCGRSTQAGIELGRRHDHTGVQQVLGVEDVLEAGERRNQLGGVHQRQQFTARAAITVFTRQRAAVAGHKPGGILHK